MHNTQYHFNPFNLFLWRQAELLGSTSSECCRHVQCLHNLSVTQLLVLLQLMHKVVRECNHSFYPVAHLAITQVGQQMAELKRQMCKIFPYD